MEPTDTTHPPWFGTWAMGHHVKMPEAQRDWLRLIVEDPDVARLVHRYPPSCVVRIGKLERGPAEGTLALVVGYAPQPDDGVAVVVDVAPPTQAFWALDPGDVELYAYHPEFGLAELEAIVS